ncbi:hypothetical protein WJX73_009176 [Symbiochloris irregularis]|uniref:Uncharacterized protein n=1 Tax=Symbiochloris irregularis TaxID=706552 RepID=A0AAW1P140_9CHLO
MSQIFVSLPPPNAPGRAAGWARNDSPRRSRAVKHSQAGRVRASSSSEDGAANAANERTPLQSALVLSPVQSQLALVTTAVLWGTNPVCLRYLDLSQQPPSPALVTSVQSAVAALQTRGR